MRNRMGVPMITLCLLLCACRAGNPKTEDVHSRYQEMVGCSMEAVIRCDQDDALWEAELRCHYVPGGESTVEVLAPETIEGVTAVIKDTDWSLEYQDAVLNAGALSSETISPALCLPRLMSALRDGWLLEKNEESWEDIPCLRLTLDQTGNETKILSTIWLRQDDGTPLRGEVSVEGEIILTAEFTSFTFYDTIT